MKILIAGDFCPQYRVAEKFEQGDYKSVLEEVKDVISTSDYSMVNFECPVTIGGEKPIEKCGPNLQCSEKGMEAVKWAGFDCVTLANNHFLDFGPGGVDNTLRACKKYGIDTVGGGMNLRDASKTMYKEIGGTKLAIINCCEHEFSISTEETAGSNPLNPIQQYYAIKEAKSKANYVLVIVHGGHEHYQLPSPRMQETYRFFVDAGADAVVNHHQHCYSGYEVYNGKPIFYGLGNFLFDDPHKRNSIWNEGFLLELIFEKERGINFLLHPYSQCNESVGIFLMKSEYKEIFNKKINELNSIISSPEKLKQCHDQMMEDTYKEYELIFQPIRSRITDALFRRKLFPSVLSNSPKLLLYNFIACESHVERLLDAVRRYKNKNSL